MHLFRIVARGFACAVGLAGGAAAAQTPYFQQVVDHVIAVQLDDSEHELHGNITTTYTNRSPETLTFLWIHLWPNAYSSGKTALAKQQFRDGNMLMFYALQRELGRIDSLSFTVNGRPARTTPHPEHPDIVRLELPAPLAPGAQLTYATPFRVALPSGSISRLGHIGQSYQITQWYPKPAVFDREGWHEMPYLNQGEFYSEYGTFDVSITLPENYVVGATGDFVPGAADNAAEERRLDSLDALTRLRFASSDLAPDDFPASATRTKTLRYTQTNVHDFAWFADKRWNVLKGSVVLPHSGNEVTTWAMFTSDRGDLWERAPEYLADGIHYYSLWNGDYPYRQVTAVDGTISAGGGMEYPNVTVIGTMSSALSLETVIVHEVGHNWFYGILGTNERTHAWMDEGINSFNETRYFATKYGDTLGFAGTMLPKGLARTLGFSNLSYPLTDQYSYLLTSRMGVDQPMSCHSNDFSSTNYGTVVYKKTAAAFAYLQGALGTEVFDRAMQAYFDAWKFRHPGPDDLRAVIERVSGKDCAWFFEGLVPTTDRVDFRAGRVRRGTGGREVYVWNRGGVGGPFELSVQDGEGKWASAGWNDPLPAGTGRWVAVPEGAQAVRVDGVEQALEYDRRNNTTQTTGVLRRMDPLELRLLTGLEQPYRTTVSFLPLVGWNLHDGWMPGLVVHNEVLPLRDFGWHVAPMWGLKSGTLTGFARMSHRFGPWIARAEARRFSAPAQAAGYVEEVYRRAALVGEAKFHRQPTSPWSSAVRVEAVDLRSDAAPVPGEFVLPVVPPRSGRQSLGVAAAATWKGRRISHSLAVNARAFAFKDYLSSPEALILTADRSAIFTAATYAGAFRYDGENHTVAWRVFGGTSTDAGVFPVLVQGPSPTVDPMRDHLFLGRVEGGIEGAQVAALHGGLAGFRAGRGSDFVVSATADADLPVKLLGVFAGAAFDGTDALASTGLYLRLPSSPNTAGGLRSSIRIPLAATGWFSEGMAYRPWESIAVVVSIDALNPFRFARNVVN